VGQFFYADVFPRNLPTASAQIIIEVPAALDLQVKAIGAALGDRVEDIGDIRPLVGSERCATSADVGPNWP
jgi:hypothetical protein